MAGLVVGVVSVVDGDELVVVVVVVSVVDGDCAVGLEHATSPPLRKRAAIVNPPHILGGNVAGFAILLRFSTGEALPTTNALSWL